MKKTIIASLTIGTAIVAAAGIYAFGSPAVATPDNSPFSEFVHETTHTPLEYVLETCKYGSAMFYVGRGIDPAEATLKAIDDCQGYLNKNGADYMLDYYGPQTNK